MKLIRASVIILFSLIILTSVFLAGYFFHEHQSRLNAFSILEEAHQILSDHGLKEIPPAPILEYGMIRGMLQAYNDPHTVFVEPPQHELQSNALEGKFGGIGVTLTKDADGFWLLFPLPDSPAVKAGIREGDRLMAVDGIPVNTETSLDVIQSAIRGPVGMNVMITIGRPVDFAPLDFVIKREEFQLPSVTWRLDIGENWIGIIKVNLIAASTPEEIQEAVKDLKSRGATHFILDLRDNPGGLLTAGVEIARLFLSDGVVMEQQYRGKDKEIFRIEEKGPLSDVPLVVLINQGSASAAEITAGALQAQKRAPLIGAPSYGKDTVQLVFNLKDDSSLRVTSARWWIPGLNPPIDGNGLQPEILVEVDPSEQESKSDPILRAAIENLLGLK